MPESANVETRASGQEYLRFCRFSAIRIRGLEKYMSTVFQVQVVRRGVITLPKELRDYNKIEVGDTLTLIDLGDGVVVMRPQRSCVDEIANKLAREWLDAGESLESMLSALHEVRAEYDTRKS